LGLNPGKGKTNISSSEHQTWLWDPLSLLPMSTVGVGPITHSKFLPWLRGPERAENSTKVKIKFVVYQYYDVCLFQSKDECPVVRNVPVVICSGWPVLTSDVRLWGSFEGVLVEECDVLWCCLCLHSDKIVLTTKLFPISNNRL
jgi:hypothetical protein